jgi:membrane fusion protein, heavy metal efflux system
MRLLVTLILLLGGVAWGAPGAHGPGGEHLDTHTHASGGTSAPRLEAQSELFELVARLDGDELSILIDRYETNEPVLGAVVEVAFGDLKAKATFHADHGDYAVDDKTMLEALAAPGEHGLVFTVTAGEEVDLLDGTLVVDAHVSEHEEHGHLLERALLAGGVVGLALLGLLLWRRRRARFVSSTLGASLVVFTLAALAAPGAHGPSGEHLDAGGPANASGLARLSDGSVNVPKLAQRRMEIRTVLAPEAEVAGTVELPGRVVMDPNAGGRVQPVHGGRVQAPGAGLPVAGQTVRKGQVLAYVRHHAEPYAEANQQASLAQLRADRAVLEQRVKRLEGLEGSVPRKEIEAARVELEALLERERRIGASLASREALTAPVPGVIATATAVNGQVVEPRDVLFEIVDPGRVLVESVVTDPALAQRIGAASLAGIDGAKLTLVGVGRSLRDGVLPVTFRSESKASLAIGQPVTVIATLKDRVRGIVLPAQAIVRNPANESVVWIKAGAERFVPQPVQFRPLDAQTVVVTRGLGADNRVVVQGASLIGQIR